MSPATSQGGQCAWPGGSRSQTWFHPAPLPCRGLGKCTAFSPGERGGGRVGTPHVTPRENQATRLLGGIALSRPTPARASRWGRLTVWSTRTEHGDPPLRPLEATELERTGRADADVCSQGRRVSLADWSVLFCFHPVPGHRDPGGAASEWWYDKASVANEENSI